MEKEKPIIAIIYDFDHTLCDQDMQNYTFIPNLDMKPSEFWGEISEFSREENMEGILSYLYYMVKLSKEKDTINLSVDILLKILITLISQYTFLSE